MEDFRSFGQFRKVPFQDFRKRIEQTPRRAILELRMGRFPPFLDDRWDHPIGGSTNIHGPDNQIVGRFIPQPVVLVSVDALALVTIDKDEILSRAREGLALNLKELAIATGYGYSTVRNWHSNGMPLLDGKITRSEALAWRKKYERSKPQESRFLPPSLEHHPLLAAGR